jgi:hypothetical protein
LGVEHYSRLRLSEAVRVSLEQGESFYSNVSRASFWIRVYRLRFSEAMRVTWELVGRLYSSLARLFCITIMAEIILVPWEHMKTPISWLTHSGSECRLRLFEAMRVPWEQLERLFPSLAGAEKDFFKSLLSYSGSESRLRLSEAMRVPWEQVERLFSNLRRVAED